MSTSSLQSPATALYTASPLHLLDLYSHIHGEMCSRGCTQQSPPADENVLLRTTMILLHEHYAYNRSKLHCVNAENSPSRRVRVQDSTVQQ